MADYAGALAAIKQRLIDNWGTTTKIAYGNEKFEADIDDNGNGVAWVYHEIISAGSAIQSAGTPGAHVVVYDGLIKCHVFTPEGSGVETGLAYAISLGEIFRVQLFYNDGDGRYVRTWTPRIEAGDTLSDDGLWFRTTMTCPFEFWHRA